jgi:AraC family transcriptional regulator
MTNPELDLQVPAAAIAGIGRVLLWSGGSLWIGRHAGRVQLYSHHAIQISLALSGRVRLRGDSHDDWGEFAGAIVWPHQRHQFDGAGESVAQIFVEPETARGRILLQLKSTEEGITRLPEETVAELAPPLRAAFFSRAEDEQLIAKSQHLVALLCGAEQPVQSADPRIGKAIEYLRSRLGGPIALEEAARSVNLSPSRFRHLFVAQTGMSFRTYLLWARVEAAVGAAMGGVSWTSAAHNWGFADSAHLSRTCRRMFGVAPTMIIRE